MSDSSPDIPADATDLLLDVVPDAAVIVTLETERIVDANERVEELLGYSRAELAGRHLLTCHPSEKAPQYRDRFEQSREGVARFDSLSDGSPAYVQTDTGREIPVEISVRPVTHRGEECLFGVFRDVTDRRETERTLDRLKRQFRTIFEHSNDAIVVIDPDTESIHEVNQQACEMLGYTREELLSLSPEDIHPDEMGLFRSFLRSVRETNQEWTDELTCRTKTGERLQSEISASIVELDGQTYVLAMIRDVTERVRRERELQRQREKLELLNQVVRHDIRNHMQVALTRLGLLEEDVGDLDGFEDIVRAAESTVDLTKTARDLTEMMLADSVSDDPVRLDTVVESEIHSLRDRYEHAEITVEGGLPETTVLADEMLDSVVHNVITNGVVHNDRESPSVGVSLERDPGTVCLRIWDNGPGIPDEKKETVFGKGEKGLDSPGTGLGLYLVRTLVEQYGGSVRIEDNQPRGSVFLIELPTADPDPISRPNRQDAT